MKAVCWTVLGLLVTACRPAPPPQFSQWASPVVPYTASPASGNAYDAYALAAMRLDRDAGAALLRVRFLPDQRRDAKRLATPAMEQVKNATRRPLGWVYRPNSPLEQPEYLRGWRLIGHCFAWSIEEAVAAGKLDRAVDLTIAATVFGWDLTHASSLEASLGLWVSERARRALVPGFERLDSRQLRRLSRGLQTALSRGAEFSAIADREQQKRMMAVQSVQDAYRDGTLDEFQPLLGKDASDAIGYLERLRAQDGPKRAAYFAGFATEAADEDAHLRSLSQALPAVREAIEEPPRAGYRPWRRFAWHFFQGPKAFLSIYEAELARTRLFALHGMLLADQKTNRLPGSLNPDLGSLAVDPYSRRPFVYRPKSAGFDLYSVGPNGIDDGGETNEAFAEPDLRIER